MTTEELRAACERRQAKKYTDDSTGWSQEDCDAYLIADAYLAEHPDAPAIYCGHCSADSPTCCVCGRGKDGVT